MAVAVIALYPALAAQEAPAKYASKKPVSLNARGGIGSFTPASADPRLAASFARAGMTSNGFRFTPASAADGRSRPVTVAVRARSSVSRADAEKIAIAAPTAVSITPIAYNLGVAVGWKRFALSGDVSRVDTGLMPGGRESVDVGVSYTGKKFSARVQAGADRPTAGQPALVAAPESYSVDLGTSYSLTKNLDVTAGLRYRSDRDRLLPTADDRRDSQAVYIGTAFKF
ncbi:hypothetical protein FHS96_001973 [Sphingomonas zeicaulis]|uniref:porin n=1 Tax=Sphingomonas zeicaulis TaxID=1632740 RepID=UPI003D2599F5